MYETLTRALNSEHDKGILVGDFNVSIKEGQTNYAQPNPLVEHERILTHAQGGFRQDKSTDINDCKLYNLTREAQRLKGDSYE